MNCYKHNEREVVGACTSCGRLVCEECAVSIRGKIVCKECVENLTANQIFPNINQNQNPNPNPNPNPYNNPYLKQNPNPNPNPYGNTNSYVNNNINRQLSNFGEISIRIISALLLIYSVYSGFLIIRSVVNSIVHSNTSILSINFFLSTIITIAYIAFCAIKVARPQTTIIPGIPLIIVDMLNSIYIHSKIIGIYKGVGIKIPFNFYVNWYLPPVLLIVIIILTIATRKK